MNRKLHNTILAFSISSGFLLLGLMAAAPLPPPPTVAQAPTQGAERAPRARAALEQAIETRTRSYEAEMARAASTAEMIALSSDFLAAVAAEAALAAVFDELAAPAPEAQTTDPAAERPRGNGRRRSALAMPYFSFAQGLRGGGGS